MNPLDKFGEIYVKNIKDNSIECFDEILAGKGSEPGMKNFLQKISSISDEEKELFRIAFIESITTGMHDFLARLQEHSDLEKDIEVLVNGIDIAKESGMLHGDFMGREGWEGRFSKHKAFEDFFGRDNVE